jgi:hypothetical protein
MTSLMHGRSLGSGHIGLILRTDCVTVRIGDRRCQGLWSVGGGGFAVRTKRVLLTLSTLIRNEKPRTIHTEMNYCHDLIPLCHFDVHSLNSSLQQIVD